MAPQSFEPRSHCPISFALDIMGDRWTLLVLRDLIIVGKRHFRELLDSEEGIASNILATRLKQLEGCGMVSRRRDPANARQLIYEPTPKSLDLIPTLVELARWGALYDSKTAAPANFVRQVETGRERIVEDILARHATHRTRKATQPRNPRRKRRSSDAS